MPVTLCCNQQFKTQRDLYQFLSDCQQVSCEKKQAQIISISLEVDAVDPLAILHEMDELGQLSFYLEKQDLSEKTNFSDDKVAIAAINSVAQFQTDNSQRFEEVKAFIQDILANTIMAGASDIPFSGPHFFCSFSFSDHPSEQACGGFAAATVFLPSWQVSYRKNRSTIVANVAIDAQTCLTSTVEMLWKNLQKIKAVKYKLINPILHNSNWLKHHPVAGTKTFQNAVCSALESIRADHFDKIVLAHAVDVVSPLPFHRIFSLNNLRTQYPDCYIFSTTNAQGQHFIGASPERLVSVQNHQLLTDALAGSAPRGNTTCEDARLANILLHSSKELHEHQVVIDFIIHQLAQLGLEPSCLPLRLLQLSNIQHLHTPIRAVVPSEIHLLDVVAALHPTPAVAGRPREITCEHIRRYEPFERSLYAAPIGWVNHRGEGEFAVGIRSALIDGCTARLFAGAGIVAGSAPERELAEVQLKLQALLTALV
ncbi:isochorismate synthase [Phormidium sp. CLA17]|uniref:isochorismate synthase n=1 Tax=Leptolyngbya sp. Cla-17 TaxID=2803751 RepID=UPI0014925433|nr:isochorismate synthase [Leptolyngbya sp. Cla-17]MBM0743139.1 isochorismate synthase [Leptolyngbya sp. Cla-17]